MSSALPNATFLARPRKLAQSWADRWVRPDFADFFLSTLNPVWRLHQPAARIVRVQSLGSDLVELVLQPNGHFVDGEAGQFVLVKVCIEGVYHTRSYSLISAPHERPLRLGIKLQGRVSRFLAKAEGCVVELSQLQGDLVLRSCADPVLLVGAGSGLSPLLALAAEALQQGQSVRLVQFGRQPLHVPQLQAWLSRYGDAFGWQWLDAAEQRFDPACLSALPWPWQSAQTYVCAPPSLWMAVQACWQQAGMESRLHCEQFAAQTMAAESTSVQPVQLLRQHREVAVTGTLLEGLEQAGLHPAHGCRMGVCNSCSCLKRSGTVRHVLTGEINTEPNVAIKLCVNVPVDAVQLDL